LVTKRIPVFIITSGSDVSEMAKFELATKWQAEQAQHDKRFALIVNKAGKTETGVDSSLSDTVYIGACLCCTGKVTLLTRLTQLLRSNRARLSQGANESRLSGIFIVLASSADVALTVDHLQQPLLEPLIDVQQIFHVGTLSVAASALGAVKAMPLFADHQIGSRVLGSVLLGPPTWDYRWESRIVFDRSRLATTFQSYTDDHTNSHPLNRVTRIDAIFRTERSWYHWKIDGPDLKLAETNFRLHSYLTITSAELNVPDAFGWLIESDGWANNTENVAHRL
jgi:hypothetical protein